MKAISFPIQVFLIGCFIASFVLPLQAQSTSGVSSDGKDFYVGLMLPSYNKVAAPSVEAFWGAFALISSYLDNVVQVSYFDLKTGVEMPGQRFSIPARTGIQVRLDSAHTVPSDAGDIAEFKSCHITAVNGPINVQFFSTGACSGGSYLSLATPALGKKYVIASYVDNPGNLSAIGGPNQPLIAEVSHGCFEIIAAFDSTKVSITSNATTSGGHPGFQSGSKRTFPIEMPYFVTLRRGQCYFVKSEVTSTDDEISSSIVTSDKPIAVLAGHENAALGGVSNRPLEGRDYMVEQMIPADYWDTTGYVSFPLKDSQPADPSQFEGVGENYRTYTWDTLGSQVQLYDACINGPINMPTGRLGQPVPERYEVTCPVDFETTNGKKFGVMKYDLRMFGTTAPYPSPSMMTIIPISSWKTSYMWYVPANKFETLQGYYVDVIGWKDDFEGQNGILASYNGGTLKPIKAVINLEQQWKNIPNHPELIGIHFKLYPGSYFATGPHPFIVYNNGDRGIDPEFDLGDMDGDDFFFSYANPTGAKLSSGDPGIFKVIVDSLCGKWNVCVKDQRQIDRGIRSVTLLNDINGNQYPPAKQSLNCHFDTTFDPSNFGEVEFPGTDSNVCFTVIVTNPTQTAYAPVLVTDNAGNTQLIQLKYSPVNLALTPANAIISIKNATLGSDTCMYLKIKNTGTSAQTISSLTLTGSNAFTLDSVPALKPLQPGDSESVKICFITRDTVTARATINITVACLTIPIQLSGSAGTALIWAHGLDFGRDHTDSLLCEQVRIDNIGTKSFTLSKNFVITGSNNFIVDTSVLPTVIQAGHSFMIRVCYLPHKEGYDTAFIQWNTDIGASFIQPGFNVSKVTGHALPPVSWTSDNQDQTVLCDDSNVVRVFLYNFPTNGATLHVNQVFFTGANASEWHIAANKTGKNPPNNFDILPRDSVWMDVVFNPELNKPLPQKYADRHAQLVATVNTELNQFIDLTGHVLYAAPVTSPDSIYFVYKAPFGTQTISTFLTDTGSAPLVIESITPISYPIMNINGIKPGDSIYPGQLNGKQINIQIAFNSPLNQDTTLYLSLAFNSSCAGTKIIPIHIKESVSAVEAIIQPTDLFSIRPNPANGNSIILTFDSPITETTEVKIFDVLGREVYKRNIFSESSIQIPIRNLQNGLYYARVNIGGKLVTEKFEVMR